MSPTTSRLLAVYGLIGACLLAFWASTAELVGLWLDFANLSYAHGFLIAALCLYLIFRDRDLLAALPMIGSPLACLALAFVSLLWLVLWRAGIQDAQLVLLPALMWLAVFAALGRRIAFALWFPFAYLYVATPGWELFTRPLQWVTVYATRFMLTLTNIPAAFEANHIYIPAGRIDIEGGCAGVNLFVSGMAFAALFGELSRESFRNRVKLLGLMAVCAIVLNWIRVYSLVVVGHLTEMRSSLMDHHYNYGWVLFVVMLFGYVKLAGRILPSKVEAPRILSTDPQTAQLARPLWVGVTAAVLLAPVAVTFARSQSAPRPSPVSLLRAPPVLTGWQGPEPALTSTWQPVFTGASTRDHAVYQASSGARLEVLVIGYLRQEQGAELVGSGNTLLTPAKETVSAERGVPSRFGEINETEVTGRNNQHYLMWSLYEVAGRRTARPFFAQLWYGTTSLFAERRSGLIALRTVCQDTCSDARTLLEQFVESWCAASGTGVCGSPVSRQIHEARANVTYSG